MAEVVVLALALSMDAFAVSVGLGSKCGASPGLALRCALYFGIFQGLMPLLGYLAGRGALGWFAAWAPWIACGLLVAIGGKMLLDAFSEGIEDDIVTLTRRVMLLLAVATSIDAMAAGFALNLLSVAPLAACMVIATTTAIASAAGIAIGGRGATWLESRAELLGGTVLILTGLRMLFV